MIVPRQRVFAILFVYYCTFTRAETSKDNKPWRGILIFYYVIKLFVTSK